LPEFAKMCPDVDVRVSTVMSTEPALRGGFDIAIRREIPTTNQYQVWPLFKEWNTVIASPSLQSGSNFGTVELLSTATWLESETRQGDWEAWTMAAGYPTLRANRTLRFDHFFVTLQAVSDGLGFGIGPFPTLEADCVSGRLLMPFPNLRSAGSTFCALVSKDRDEPIHMKAFIDWLLLISANSAA
jgi:LysR family glycine cleavage system transcriptional activator